MEEEQEERPWRGFKDMCPEGASQDWWRPVRCQRAFPPSGHRAEDWASGDQRRVPRVF